MRQESLTAVRTASLGIVLACGLATARGDVISQGGSAEVEVVDLSEPVARAPMMQIPETAGVGRLLIETRDLGRAQAPARRKLMKIGSKVYYGRSTTVLSSVVVILGEDVTSLRQAKRVIRGVLSTPPTAPGSARVRPIAELPANWVLVRFDTVGEAIDALDELRSIPGVKTVELEVDTPRQSYAIPSDPFVQYQWHLDNTRFPGSDLNVEPVWDAGFTGQGVVVGVMDAGRWNMQLDHPDLNDNIRMDLVQSYSQFPEVADYGIGDHATAVAGLIAGEANNGEGVAGIAYDAKLAAIVHTGSASTIATGISYKTSQIDVRVHPWGFPATDYPTFFDPDAPYYPYITPNDLDGGDFLPVIPQALVRTFRTSNEKHVFGSGNGNRHESFALFARGNALQTDEEGNVYGIGALDGDGDFETAAPYSLGERTEYSRFAKWRDSIVIGAIGEDNDHTWYSTTGCNVLAVAYTEGVDVLPDNGFAGGGVYTSRSLVTTSEVDGSTDSTVIPTHPAINTPNSIYSSPLLLPDGYTAAFGGNSFLTNGPEGYYGGTSAAAANATGVIALMLDANPNLSIRDIKRIIQATADWRRIEPTVSPVDGSGNALWTTIEEELGATAGNPDIYGNFSFWQVNGGDVPHSDEYGFGVIDAQAAVAMAQNYQRPQLIIADSGILEVDDGEIEDATYEEIGELESSIVIPPARGFSFCVPPNLSVEDVEVTITVEGLNPGDLLVWLESPTGSTSNLLFPRLDNSGVIINGTNYAYYRYKMNTLKHWGELGGGIWTLWLRDFRPDDELPEGDETDDDPPETDPRTINFGVYGLPSLTDETEEKTVTELQLTVYGTASGQPGYEYCGLVDSTCPGDVNADGRVNLDDLQLFIDIWMAGDPLADINGDSAVDFSDLLAFFLAWQPGYCGVSADRPVDSNKPTTRPIQGQF